ncbi:NAD-dependent epimerase/dehydratase family protein [Starkeya sp. ORNL1]|uniref:NAD-dependent epimerase/dehydratase family protein n=1 Tax=Starkeya sp. ORNL1 TaxID=2709380 RepID=UPI00146351D1|nr:NAD-dependent epimerase/dehydratase family protein [Starkeya sp. ORNL1]QJP15433.1 NAD-dependent epimerase/dehydratase family protein [Starkeya sp. ORNL1]
MRSLLCLGLGYCASRFIELHGAGFDRRLATSRTGAAKGGNVEMLRVGSPELEGAARTADVVLISAPPGESGDPFLGPLGEAIAVGSGPLIYLSTIGVYGNSDGAWIDETAPLQATAPRGRRRIEAEAGWQELGKQAGRPVTVLRLGGIYGPGRNALADIADGDARCIVREGQMFNRIHVDDIAGAILAAATRGHDGAVNVVDDEPAEACAPVRFAAMLLGAEPPPAVPFDEAAPLMSAMARSFWADNRRVRNLRLKHELGVALRYPSYREGLTALFEAGEGRSA